MTLAVILALMVSASCFSSGPKYARGQELPPPNKNATNKTVILKQSIQSAAKYCSSLHDTTTVRVLALMLTNNSDDQNSKCFLHCMLRRYRLMDDKGVYHQEKFQAFLDYIPDSAFLRSIKGNVSSCVKERGNSPCESAYKFISCFYSKARAQNKLPNVNGS